MACFVTTVIKRHLIAALMAIFKRYSSPLKVLDGTIGTTTPDQTPSFLLIRTRSRSVRLPAVSWFNSVSVVTDLDIQTQGFLHEEDGVVPLNRFETFFNLCAFQVCGLVVCPIIFLFKLFWCFRLFPCYAAVLGLV